MTFEGTFDGTVVLVTGGSRGIGRAVVERFAAAGATVVVQYRTQGAAAKEVLAGLPAGDHLALQADVADPDQVRTLVQDVVDRLGRIDVLVNNAGIYERHPVLGTSYAEWQESWRRTIETNLVGPANLVHEVVPHMVAAGGGRIVNVTSRGAFRGEPEHTAYGASKAGLNSLSQSLARELAPHGIYVTAVAPGFVETDMANDYLNGPDGEAVRAQSPLLRAATPDEIARVVVFMATPGAESTTGAIVDVNGASYLRT
ncbi:SDR family oxidoreductase [Pseudonocardia aurantiaca]|uniref:SDR family NAD(P)-dependent oxidoreductase n=1 Tax=Pseudonocardia aurantiaca TaxID=75290 RepID=A0ABW4FR05_9PSEU